MNLASLVHSVDWNVLVLLDACRFDFFRLLNPFKGKLNKVKVPYSCTPQFLKGVFKEKYPYVYISASPYCNSKCRVKGFLGTNHFKEVIDVWDFGWTKKYRTVLPNIVTKEALKKINANKLIVHYMQPHAPYVGKIKNFYSGWRNDPLHVGSLPHREPKPSVKLLKKAYAENLRLVFGEVEKLLNFLPKDRKVVIMSDHGELLGENGKYFHNCSWKHQKLSEVPWFELESQWN